MGGESAGRVDQGAAVFVGGEVAICLFCVGGHDLSDAGAQKDLAFGVAGLGARDVECGSTVEVLQGQRCGLAPAHSQDEGEEDQGLGDLALVQPIEAHGFGRCGDSLGARLDCGLDLLDVIEGDSAIAVKQATGSVQVLADPDDGPVFVGGLEGGQESANGADAQLLGPQVAEAVDDVPERPFGLLSRGFGSARVEGGDFECDKSGEGFGADEASGVALEFEFFPCFGLGLFRGFGVEALSLPVYGHSGLPEVLLR